MNRFRWLRRFWWWLVSFWLKQRRLIIYVSGGSIVLFVVLKNLWLFLPQFKPARRIGIIGQYTLENLPKSIRERLNSSLFQAESDGSPNPLLADDYRLSPDGLTYQVRLKPGSLWSDGTNLKSQDLSFSLPDVTVSYPDDLTVEFKLSQPYAPFLQLLTQPLFKSSTVGAGGYSIKDSDWQGQYLKRLRLVGPNEELDYRFYFSHSAAWLGFRLGEVDRLENLLLNPAEGRWDGRVEVTGRLNRQVYVGLLFNLENASVSNKSLRQALAYALKEKAPDQSSRALSPVSPDSWAFNAEVKPYDFNPAQARELFAKYQEEAPAEAELSLTIGTSISLLKQAEAVAASWNEVLPLQAGVRIVNSLEPDWQVMLAAQEIPSDPDQHAFWHSTQSTNLTGYSDLRVDKLLEDGRQISHPDRRREIYQDFQRFLAEDLPAIFLYHPTSYTLSRQ